MKRAPNSLRYFICFLSFIFNVIRFFHTFSHLPAWFFLHLLVSTFYYHPTAAFRLLLVREQTQCKVRNLYLEGQRESERLKLLKVFYSHLHCVPSPPHAMPHTHKNSCNSFLVRQHILRFFLNSFSLAVQSLLISWFSGNALPNERISAQNVATAQHPTASTLFSMYTLPDELNSNHFVRIFGGRKPWTSEKKEEIREQKTPIAFNIFLCNAGKITFGNKVSQRDRTSVERAWPRYRFHSFSSSPFCDKQLFGVLFGICEEWQVPTIVLIITKKKN